MKRFAAMLAIVGFVATTSFAGVVEFDPPNFEFDPNNPVPIQVNVIASTAGGGTISGIDMVIGSSDLTVAGLTYTEAFLNGTAFNTPPTPIGIFPSDVLLGGFATTPFASPLLIGTLTLNLPAVAGTPAPGTVYEYFVDSTADGGFSNLNGGESLSGLGTVTIVPEPATLCLLGLGAVGLIRRRLA